LKFLTTYVLCYGNFFFWGDIFWPQHAVFAKSPFCTCSWQMWNGGRLSMKCRKNRFLPV
jgi:hypothetical protein